jgi:hypothetical protein
VKSPKLIFLLFLKSSSSSPHPSSFSFSTFYFSLSLSLPLFPLFLSSISPLSLSFPQSKVGETTWSPWATCSCTSTVVAFPGRCVNCVGKSEDKEVESEGVWQEMRSPPENVSLPPSSLFLSLSFYVGVSLRLITCLPSRSFSLVLSLSLSLSLVCRG